MQTLTRKLAPSRYILYGKDCARVVLNSSSVLFCARARVVLNSSSSSASVLLCVSQQASCYLAMESAPTHAGQPSRTPQETELLYATVLQHWRRCHREGGVLADALREAEAECKLLRAEAHTATLAERRETVQAGLFRFLRGLRGLALHNAIRTWTRFCTAVRHRCISLRHCVRSHGGLTAHDALKAWGASCARLTVQRSAELVRRERAALKEVEAQLELAHETERELRAHWQRKQEEELALVAALSAQPIVLPVAQLKSLPPPPLAARPPPPQPPARLPPLESMLASARPPAPRREQPLGVRAENLVAAFRRESSAAAGICERTPHTQQRRHGAA